ncbi:MAG: crossover junction endodeoxyribonuclease RuvC [Patescibacteria group bacterium]
MTPKTKQPLNLIHILISTLPLATTDTYRILGVDPGTNIMGYAIIEIRKKEIFLVEMGVVKMSKFDNAQDKLQKIFERLQAIIKRHNPKQMAIEAPFFGKNVQSMLKLGRAQGVAIAAAMTLNVEIQEYAPKKIKLAVTGSGNASKEQVSAMLDTILKQKLQKDYFDATDALATAVCHFYQSGRGGSTGKKYSGWEGFLKDNPGKKKKM